MRPQIKLALFLSLFISVATAITAKVEAQYPQQVPSQIIVLKAGKLIDPEKGTTELNQLILVRDKKIEVVGPNVQIPTGARIIDLSNSTVMPGLFDAHTHLCMTVKKERDNGNYYITTLLDPTPYRAIEGVANARDMLAAGFTSVRDVGNSGNYGDTALREAIERGVIPGPTMVTAGRIIAPYGGQFHLQPEKRDLATPEYIFADTHDEMIKAIHENIHYGATVIKIVIDDQKYIYSVDDIKFMIAEAHRDGLKLAAHAWTQPGARNAAEAGVDSIEHGQMMTDADLQIAKKNHVVLVGTDFSESAARQAGFPELHSVFVDRLKRAYQVGVTMAFGTDVIWTAPGETRGTLAMEYVSSWSEAGVPPKDTLQAMTINAARLLGVEKERGAIKPGMAADIIAMPENPLDNIHGVRRVSFVMKDGSVFKSE